MMFRFLVVFCFLFLSSEFVWAEDVLVRQVDSVKEKSVSQSEVAVEIVSSPIFPMKELPKVVLQGKIDKKFKGITIIDFWASWCLPCKESFPYYEKLLKNPKWKKRVRVIAINLDEEKKLAIEFLKKNKVNFPVIWDADKKFATSLGVLVLPTAYFIKPNGYYIDKKGFTVKQIPEIEKTLQDLDRVVRRK